MENLYCYSEVVGVSYLDKSISEELVIFMFNHEKFQRAIELEQIKMDEKEITRFYKNLSRSGGWLTTQPVNGVYKMICTYETTTKGIVLSISYKEGKTIKYRKEQYSWEFIANGIMKSLNSMSKQLVLF